MAKVNVETLSEEMLAGNRDSANGPQVSFFSLKDGEEAIVRILISNYNDFDIHTVHNVKMEGYQYGRRMNCLRQPNDPMEMCPLCAADQKLEQKMYIHMIQYTVEGDKIVPHAKVWERSILDRGFGVNAFKTYLTNYGDLSEMICKITRTGSGLNTNYTFIPNLNPAVYRPDLYVKDTSAFENWSPIGIAILNKTAEEYNTFLATGSFPQTQSQNRNSTNISQGTARTYVNTGNSSIPQASGQANVAPAGSTSVPDTYVPGVTVNPVVEAPAQPTYTPPVMNPNPSIPNQPIGEVAFGSTSSPNPVNSMPWNNSAPSGFDRPRRY